MGGKEEIKRVKGEERLRIRKEKKPQMEERVLRCTI